MAVDFFAGPGALASVGHDKQQGRDERRARVQTSEPFVVACGMRERRTEDTSEPFVVACGMRERVQTSEPFMVACGMRERRTEDMSEPLVVACGMRERRTEESHSWLHAACERDELRT